MRKRSNLLKIVLSLLLVPAIFLTGFQFTPETLRNYRLKGEIIRELNVDFIDVYGKRTSCRQIEFDLDKDGKSDVLEIISEDIYKTDLYPVYSPEALFYGFDRNEDGVINRITETFIDQDLNGFDGDEERVVDYILRKIKEREKMIKI
ncbi:MAG: hypothetical protein KKF68_03955 [Nanoarchaeota archaeon]|nr:hypothetical protein [Nanoarchaeota archaeon]